MDELVLVAVVMATPVFLLAELRRMLSSFLINRSIQKALETAPDQIPLLTERLDRNRPPAISVTGLGAAVIGDSQYMNASSARNASANSKAARCAALRNAKIGGATVTRIYQLCMDLPAV